MNDRRCHNHVAIMRLWCNGGCSSHAWRKNRTVSSAAAVADCRSCTVPLFGSAGGGTRLRRMTITTTTDRRRHRHQQEQELRPPTVVYSSNHLLVIDKPPGWKSVPDGNHHHRGRGEIDCNANDDNDDNKKKCLLTYLKGQRLGGGSDGTFLRPLHRLDQPCSGLLLLGKTTKASQRIQSRWNDEVHKQYICVFDREIVGTNLSMLREYSSSDSNNGWMSLQGYSPRKRRRIRTRNTRVGANMRRRGRNGGGGWSVSILPELDAHADPTDFRHCAIRWKQLIGESDDDEIGHRNGHDTNYIRFITLLVETNQGSRHLIRALFAMAGCPIAGDLRYGGVGGSSSNRRKEIEQIQPLKDLSVALHARRLRLPDDLFRYKDNNNNNCRQQQQTHGIQNDFVAPIPATWETYFGIAERDVSKLLK